MEWIARLANRTTCTFPLDRIVNMYNVGKGYDQGRASYTLPVVDVMSPSDTDGLSSEIQNYGVRSERLQDKTRDEGTKPGLVQ